MLIWVDLEGNDDLLCGLRVGLWTEKSKNTGNHGTKRRKEKQNVRRKEDFRSELLETYCCYHGLQLTFQCGVLV